MQEKCGLNKNSKFLFQPPSLPLNPPSTILKPILRLIGWCVSGRNSVSDLFHKNIPTEYIARVFDTMERADWHIYQVLTKRSSLMRDFVHQHYRGQAAPPHIWLGVSIENAAAMTRLRHLKQTNASVRFVSFEPLLGPLSAVNLEGIHWIIAGGESGPGARPMQIEWVRSLRDQCQAQRVAFFFKQWGGRTPKTGGNTLDGRQWLEYPRVQRYPTTLC